MVERWAEADMLDMSPAVLGDLELVTQLLCARYLGGSF